MVWILALAKVNVSAVIAVVFVGAQETIIKSITYSKKKEGDVLFFKFNRLFNIFI